MFKVICVDNYFVNKQTGKITKRCPQIGEIVTVIKIDDNGNYYLEEYPVNDFGNITRWNHKKFIPLSNIDETELIKER